MGWIVKSLANVFLGIVQGLIAWGKNVTDDLALDLGTKGNFFAQTFKGIGKFNDIFILIGVILVISIFIFKMIQAMFGPAANGEDPLPVAVRTVLAIVGVFSSYKIYKVIQGVGSIIYDAFKGVAYDGYAGIGKLLDPDAVDKMQGASSAAKAADNNFISTIVVLFVGFALVIEFFKLFLELFERYVTMGVLYYTSPMAFSMITSRATTPIFTSWLQMVISQMILMCMNLFFMGTFYRAVKSIDTKQVMGEDGSVSGWMATMFMLVAWLIVGQKIDSHLRGLGLSAAQTGSSLGATILGASHAMQSTMRTAGSLLGAPGKIAGAAGKVKGAIGGISKAGQSAVEKRAGLDASSKAAAGQNAVLDALGFGAAGATAGAAAGASGSAAGSAGSGVSGSGAGSMGSGVSVGAVGSAGSNVSVGAVGSAGSGVSGSSGPSINGTPNYDYTNDTLTAQARSGLNDSNKGLEGMAARAMLNQATSGDFEKQFPSSKYDVSTDGKGRFTATDKQTGAKVEGFNPDKYQAKPGTGSGAPMASMHGFNYQARGISQMQMSDHERVAAERALGVEHGAGKPVYMDTNTGGLSYTAGDGRVQVGLNHGNHTVFSASAVSPNNPGVPVVHNNDGTHLYNVEAPEAMATRGFHMNTPSSSTPEIQPRRDHTKTLSNYGKRK